MPSRRKIILFWDHPWSVPTEGFPEGDIGGCKGTYNRSKLPKAGAIVFHYSNLDKETMPWKYYRDPEQIFIFFSHESPSYVIHGEHRHAMTKFDNHFINWTMTYRTDSDVFAPYGQSKFIHHIIEKGKGWVDSKMAKKKKVAHVFDTRWCHTVVMLLGKAMAFGVFCRKLLEKLRNLCRKRSHPPVPSHMVVNNPHH
ncbi:unnamed protein product [Clavelina lepadiformis]|uniref:Fucosyltransferase N-terminal domain-containing protein n=1 Tax=Clavelina lepadiformis TaxID=159417 RepID=A0ABP0FLC6_CLALP